jgi:hypothetical protein
VSATGRVHERDTAKVGQDAPAPVALDLYERSREIGRSERIEFTGRDDRRYRRYGPLDRDSMHA